MVRGLIGRDIFSINEAVLTKINLLDAPHPTDMVMPIASIVSGNHMRSTGRHDPSEHNSFVRISWPLPETELNQH